MTFRTEADRGSAGSVVRKWNQLSESGCTSGEIGRTRVSIEKIARE